MSKKKLPYEDFQISQTNQPKIEVEPVVQSKINQTQNNNTRERKSGLEIKFGYDLADYRKGQIDAQTFLQNWRCHPADPLLGKTPFCFNFYCTGVSCRYTHLDWNVYCIRRYTCRNPKCTKPHYEEHRSNNDCLFGSDCRVDNCPFAIHNCRFGIKCNRPNCDWDHPPERSETFCYYGDACNKKETCPLKHHIPEPTVNTPSAN